MLGRSCLALGQVHDLCRQHRLAHRSARPPDHLSGQHRADPDLLAEADQQRRDPGRVGLGQLGQIADSHQHFGPGVAATNLDIAGKRCREAGVDWSQDRVEQVRPLEFLHPGGQPVQAVEVVRVLGDQHRGGAQVLRQIDRIRREAEHVVHTGRVRHPDVLGVERVDAQRQPATPAAPRSSAAPRSATSSRATGRGRSRRLPPRGRPPLGRSPAPGTATARR